MKAIRAGQIAALSVDARSHGVRPGAGHAAAPAICHVGLQIEALVDGAVAVVVDPVAALDPIVAALAAHLATIARIGVSVVEVGQAPLEDALAVSAAAGRVCQ